MSLSTCESIVSSWRLGLGTATFATSTSAGNPVLKYLVLGMHKSGTTVLARTLHLSGISMGEFDESLTYDQGNHYEREETQRLNKILLDCGDAHSLTVVRTISLHDASHSTTREMTAVVHDLDAKHESWGFKDPRSCLTLGVWRALLREYRVVGIYRHPLEIWNRYIHSRDPWVRLRRVGRGWSALKAWHVYNSQLLRCRDEPDAGFLLLEYGRFMDEPDSLVRLGDFVGTRMRDVREPELYRAHQQASWLYRIVRFLNAKLFGRDVDALYLELEGLSKDTRSDSSQR